MTDIDNLSEQEQAEYDNFIEGCLKDDEEEAIVHEPLDTATLGGAQWDVFYSAHDDWSIPIWEDEAIGMMIRAKVNCFLL